MINLEVEGEQTFSYQVAEVENQAFVHTVPNEPLTPILPSISWVIRRACFAEHSTGFDKSLFAVSRGE